MNGLLGETAIVILGLGNIGWLVLLGQGRLRTAGPARKGAAPPPPRVSANGHQPRDASGRFAKPEPLLRDVS